jgi:hypothetical protein
MTSAHALTIDSLMIYFTFVRYKLKYPHYAWNTLTSEASKLERIQGKFLAVSQSFLSTNKFIIVM